VFRWAAFCLTFFLGAAATWGVIAAFIPQALDSPIRSPPTLGQGAPPQHTRLYTEAEKNNLLDALHALSVDLSANAAAAVDKTIDLVGLWQEQIRLLNSSAEKVSPTGLVAQLKEVRDSLTQYEVGLDAVLSHNDDYRSELQSVLGNDGPKTLNLFREALIDVDSPLQALVISHRTTTPDTINVEAAILKSMTQCMTIMRERGIEFATWANESRKNIDTLRGSLR
jgi:hypothetical protein